MSQEDLKHSTTILKKVVPLMMQHKIATTPSNYALWYTYVDQSVPELNQALDNTISEHGVCPPSSNDMLYQQYVAKKTETSLEDLRKNLEIMVQEVSHSVSDTLQDSTTFTNMIDKSFSDLERVEEEGLSVDEVMSVVRQLVKESREIRSSANFFNHQLSTAGEEISRLKSQLEEVKKDVLIDSLSSLFNRRAFDSDLRSLVESNQPFSLILLDLDHFKNLNDTYGHVLGDAVIKAVAKRIDSIARDGIRSYRYGGEEFAILVPNKSLRSARQFAEATRRSLEKLSIKDRRAGQYIRNITASFGVAEYENQETIEQLVTRADKQLYEAKELGRNRVMPL